MAQYLHDMHFHLDLYEDIESLVKSIESNAIYTIAVTNLPALFSKLEKTIKSKYIRIALGMHPELVYDYQRYIPMVWEYLDLTKYIGEVGLSLKGVSKQNKEAQIEFLEELIMRCSKLGNKILSIHSQNSVDEVLLILKNSYNCKNVLHWYSGTISNLNKALDMGCYFSINYAMLLSVKGINIIERIPINKILLESDGPFVNIDNKLYHPSDMSNVVNKLSKVKKIESKELESVLYDNFTAIIR